MDPLRPPAGNKLFIKTVCQVRLCSPEIGRPAAAPGVISFELNGRTIRREIAADLLLIDMVREEGAPVLAVALKDEPGSFAKVMGVLAEAGIDVEYVYTFLTPRPDSACMIFRVADNEVAEKALSAAGIRLASKEEFD